jgi:hypothetical protein
MTSQSAIGLGSVAVTCSTPERCREQPLREAKQRQRGSASASLGRDGYRLIGWPGLVAFAKRAV